MEFDPDILDIHVDQSLRQDFQPESISQKFILDIHEIFSDIEKSSNGLLFHPLLPRVVMANIKSSNFEASQMEGVKQHIVKQAAEGKFPGASAVIAGKLFEADLCEDAKATVISSTIYCLAAMTEAEQETRTDLPFTTQVMGSSAPKPFCDDELDDICLSYTSHIANFLQNTPGWCYSGKVLDCLKSQRLVQRPETYAAAVQTLNTLSGNNCRCSVPPAEPPDLIGTRLIIWSTPPPLDRYISPQPPPS
jgi:hypothetical protein